MTAAQSPSFRDDLNPKFVYLSDVHFDELDAMKMLHNARFAAHVERAVTALWETSGGLWRADVQSNPDQFHVVRDFHIEFLRPFLGTGTMRIDVWVEKIGTTSCVFGFLCSSADGMVAHARGDRTIVKVDPKAHTPVPWSDGFRTLHATMMKDLPAYA